MRIAFLMRRSNCHGLEMMGLALRMIEHPDAELILRDGKQYREDLLRAYRWTKCRLSSSCVE